MFGSTTPFGQSSNSPFGSPLVFGQNSNASSNQFAPKPFVGTTPFGSPTGESIFYGTSTGGFGANSSPAGSTSTFHAPSYSACGSSAPAVGSSSSSFGGSSIFGQKPVFGGFVSNPNQSNSFGISFQQTQTTFQSNPFGSSTSFGTSTQNASGAARSPAFGAPISSHNSVAAFGFGTCGGALGSGAANTLGASNTSIFGVSKDSSIGASSSPTFGTSSTARFDVGTTPTFGQSTSASGSSSFFGTAPSAFGAQNLSFGFGQLAFSGQHGGSRVAAYTATAEVDDNSSTQLAAKLQSISAMTINKDKSHEELRWEDYQSGDKGGLCCMGQSAGGIGFGGSTVQSSSFGPSPTLFHSTVNPFYSSTASNSFAPQTSVNPFQPQTSSTPSGPQSTMPTFGITGFGQSAFSSQHGRSRVAAYIATAEVDGASSTQHAAKLQSISAMPINKDKNHEELRWKDYQSGDKGGPHRMSQSAVGIGNGGSTIHSNHICPPALTQSSVNPFYSLTTSNPFTHQTSSTPFAPKTSSTPFTPQTSSNSFAPTVPEFSSLFFNKPSANSFGTSSSSAPSPFVIVPAPAPGFGPLPSIFSSTSALETASGFNSGSSSANTQFSPIFQSVAPLAQRSSSGQSVANSLSQPNNFSAPSTESQLGGNFFSSTLSALSMSNPAGFSQITPSFSSPLQPTQIAQTTDVFASSKFPQSSAGLSGFVGTTGVLGQSIFSPLSATQSSVALQPAPNVSPFGSLHAMPQLSIDHPGSTPVMQFGISSMPVFDKPAAPVRMSSLLTSRHLSQRRIGLPARKYDPKSDGPRVPFFSNDQEMPTTYKADALSVPRENPGAIVLSNTDKRSPLVHASLHEYKHGKISTEVSAPALLNGAICQDEDGCKAGESEILKEHLANVEALMPRLARFEYYTKPKIPDLSTKERAEPGFCSHVKDFVVGRHGYGNIKFLGETDVRKLDLDSLIQFNNREVVVYMDGRKKPPVGQGLNKAAEVTLLNVKCIDKKTRKEYINGPKVDKYREMLIKKATEQGAEFVSYDPVEGEWKFRVQHFSRYKF